MSSAGLIRWSGFLAIAAGAYVVLSPLVHPSSPQSAAWVPMHLLFFFALIATLLALVGILAYQLRQAGRLENGEECSNCNGTGVVIKAVGGGG